MPMEFLIHQFKEKADSSANHAHHTTVGWRERDSEPGHFAHLTALPCELRLYFIRGVNQVSSHV